MIRSARLPGSSDPTRAPHLTIDAGVRVTIAARSRSDKPNPPASLAVLAAFNSFSRFLLPVGDQSGPRPIGTPADLAALTFVVPPYSSRLLNGDHTIEPPRSARTAKSSGCSLVQWIPASAALIAHSPWLFCNAEKARRALSSTPSLRWSNKHEARSRIFLNCTHSDASISGI